MPKIIKSPPVAATAGEPSPPVKARDFLALGYAVALRDIAEENGVSVEGLQKLPSLLEGAGLPTVDKIDRRVWIMAHRLHRDHIDAVMWRSDEFDGELKAKKAGKELAGLFQ